jgi:hypothetical protein
MNHPVAIVWTILCIATCAGYAHGQASPYAIELTALFDTSTCQVSNPYGVRPKVCGSGNELQGCAQANVIGRSYSSGPVAAKNILVHPPEPAYQYTRVQFGPLDTIPNGVNQVEDWVITFACGVVHSANSNSDGVDLYIRAGGVAQGCQVSEVLLHQRTVPYGQAPEYVAVVVPGHIIQRAASFVALEVRPRGHNYYDHLVVSNPVMRPASVSVSLADSFSSASVVTTNFVPLTSSWSVLSQNPAQGGAALVPPSVLSACSGWTLNQGNNDYNRTLLVVPPPPPNQFCRVDYPVHQFVGSNAIRNHDWFFSARVSLNSGIPSGGATVAVLAEGANPSGAMEWQALGSFPLNSGQSHQVCIPLSLWTARDQCKINIQIDSGGNNEGDLVLIENPRIVALPLSHGMDSITEFAFWFGYTTGNYPSHVYAPTDPEAPQFDDIEQASTAMIVHVPDPLPVLTNRIAEARRLGQSIIWIGGLDVFFNYYTGTLWPDYVQRWNNAKNTVVAPNLDVIKYIYIEEVHTHSGNYAAANTALAVVGALVKADFPQLKLIYGEVGSLITSSGVQTFPAIDIPSSFDIIGFENVYTPSVNGQEVLACHAGLNRLAKANHKFVLFPPCIDVSGANELDKALVLESFLRLARTDERYTVITPWMWWWQPLPAFGGQLGLYDYPDSSAYKRRYLGLGKSIRERHVHREQLLSGGGGMGCPGAADLKVFSSERLASGVPLVISLRGAPAVTPTALLLGSYWSYSPSGCGYILGPDPGLAYVIIETDHLGRYVVKLPAVAGPLDMYLQAGYFYADVPVLTNTIRMKYD